VQPLQIRHSPMHRVPVFAFCSRVFGASGTGNVPSVPCSPAAYMSLTSRCTVADSARWGSVLISTGSSTGIAAVPGDGLDIRGSKFIGSIPLARRSALVRIAIDGTNDASQFLARGTAGKLQPGGPYTVREASR